jgi:hypothetical protein
MRYIQNTKENGHGFPLCMCVCVQNWNKLNAHIVG